MRYLLLATLLLGCTDLTIRADKPDAGTPKVQTTADAGTTESDWREDMILFLQQSQYWYL